MSNSSDALPSNPILLRGRTENSVVYDPTIGRVRKYASPAPSRLLTGLIDDSPPHLLPCFSAVNDPKNPSRQKTLWLYCPGGDLQQRFNCHRLVDGLQLTVVQQLMTGWRNLRRIYRLIHLDLKPANILWGGVTHGVLIADFELAVDCNGDEAVEVGFCGTREWMAPEQLAGRESKRMKVSEKTDVWALGRMIIWLYTRRLNPSEQELKVIPKWLRKLAVTMTDPKPSNRPGLTELEAESSLWTSGRTSPVLETVASPSIGDPETFSSTGTATGDSISK